MPHQAAIIAIPPKPLNNLGLKISTSANPEFCIPVSIDIALRSTLGKLNIVLMPKPENKATALCSKTKINIKWMYFIKFPKLANSATRTNPKNIRIEKIRIGLAIFFVKFGNFLEKYIPVIRGMPNRINTVLNISMASSSIGINIFKDSE